MRETKDMTELQIYLTFVVFAGVILAIAFNVIDLTLATLLGVSILTVTGVLTREDVVKTQETAGGTIALLFGGMVVARILATTGIFEWVGALYLREHERQRQTVFARPGRLGRAVVRIFTQCDGGHIVGAHHYPSGACLRRGLRRPNGVDCDY